MSLLIPGTNSIKDTTYDVDNSLRFNDGSSDSLTRTPSGAGNRDKWTWSGWIKRSTLSTNQKFFSCGNSSTTFMAIQFNADDTLGFGDSSSGSTVSNIFTDQVFRDPNSWYHIVAHYDSGNSTSTDRLRLYVNGSRVTDLNNTTFPSQNTDGLVNSTTVHNIGQRGDNNHYFDGYMAEVCFIDGSNLDPDQFGKFNSDSPTIWQPIDVSGLTFGTNGFHLDFENASSLGADVSGNSNNFTVNNLTSVDQSTDTCTNNYATFNSLLNTNGTLSEGNLQAQSPASGGNGGISTFGASKGKWYAEFKQVAESTANEGALAVIDTTFLHNSTLTSAYLEYTAGTYGLRDGLSSGVGFYTSGGSVTSNSSFHGNWTTNDIIGIALDIDNNRVYFSKNGQWTDGSGNYDESNPTGYLTIQSDHGEGTYMFAVGDSSSANNVTWQGNFGSPPFSISSGNSDANGYGNFEYPVPSGYYALNSKNLAEFG